jgi:hypothetical protein
MLSSAISFLDGLDGINSLVARLFGIERCREKLSLKTNGYRIPFLARTGTDVNKLGPSPIVFSEWLPTGVMVHFEGGVSVFFSAKFLYEQREVQPNQVFRTDEPFTSGEIKD